MAECSSLPGSAVETLVLAFDLVDYELEKGPAQVLKALKSQKLQDAVADALMTQAEAFLKKQREGLPLDTKEASKDNGKVVGKAMLDAGKSQITRDIKNSSAYVRLERGLLNLKCAYDKSVVGVWVDQNKGKLLIIATGLVVGAFTAMYITESGDLPADWIAQLTKESLKTINLGKIELGLKEFKFVPSKREVEFQLYASPQKWKELRDTTYRVSVKTKDDKLTSLGLEVETKVPITKAFSQTLKGTVDPIASRYSLALGVKGTSDGLSLELLAEYKHDQGKDILGGSGVVSYKGKLGKVPVSIQGKAGVQHTFGPSQKTDVNVMLGLSVPISFL